MSLNLKQEQFCQEYIIDLNATQAYIRAGYEEKSANVTSSQLLANPKVQLRIQELMDERARRTEITQDKVLTELWSIAQEDIKNFLSFKPIAITTTSPITGLPQTENKIDVEIKDSATISTKNISEVSIGKDGQFKFKLYCRDTALVNVGKHLGMFKEVVDMTLKEEIDVNKLTPEEKLTYLKLFKKARS